jgi:ABC-type amino acid transport substrate-binding protein
VRGLEDLEGKTVAVVRGSVQDKDLEQLLPETKRIAFGTISEAVLAVTGGRADAFAHDDIVALMLARKNPDLKEVGRPFIPRPYGIAVRKGDLEFVKWVNAELARMRSDGTYGRLWKKYFADLEGRLVKP